MRPASCTPRALRPVHLRGTSNRIPDSSYLRLAAEIGRHQSSPPLGSPFLFSAPSFLAAVFLTHSEAPPRSPHPPVLPLGGCFLSASLPCTLSHPPDDVPAFHSRRWTTLPSRLSNPPVCFYPWPHSDSAGPLPDMDIQGCKSFRACRNPRFVSLPILCLLTHQYECALYHSQSYEWKPNLT